MQLFKPALQVPSLQTSRGTGWLTPTPDLRDYTDQHEEVAGLARQLKLASSRSQAKLPAKVDLRQWCSGIEDQGNLGACTAHAIMGAIEYLENRAFGTAIDGSRLFVYKITRNLMAVKGDTGAWLRNAMGAAVLCGIPPEKYWPYTDQSPAFDEEPTAFVFSLAQQYTAMKYFCHDPLSATTDPKIVLTSVKKYLAAGIPSVFGFYLFSSFEQGGQPGAIPYPDKKEKTEGGHAVLAVGYDDRLKIKNQAAKVETTGALLIRNSWSPAWGDQGYGWLPYRYVLERLALDFWSALSMAWVETKQFGL